ncbi:aldehyde dehydrogenase, partial [Pseudomonas laurentiana]|nr:aldehyde dehydrogenase [Pseudomonas laurentiana]
MSATAPLLPAVESFLKRAPRMLIGADWVEATDGALMTLSNPATGEPLCQVPSATPADVERAVLAA